MGFFAAFLWMVLTLSPASGFGSSQQNLLLNMPPEIVDQYARRLDADSYRALRAAHPYLTEVANKPDPAYVIFQDGFRELVVETFYIDRLDDVVNAAQRGHLKGIADLIIQTHFPRYTDLFSFIAKLDEEEQTNFVYEGTPEEIYAGHLLRLGELIAETPFVDFVTLRTAYRCHAFTLFADTPLAIEVNTFKVSYKTKPDGRAHLKLDNYLGTEIPAELRALPLTKLTLNAAQLDQFPENLGQAWDLTHVNLTCPQVYKFPHFLAGMQNLVSLDLTGTVSYYPEEVAQMTTLKRLSLVFVPGLLSNSYTALTNLENFAKSAFEGEDPTAYILQAQGVKINEISEKLINPSCIT